MKMVYFIDVTPTHRDGLSEENAARILQDEEKNVRLTDLPVIIPKLIGLVCALFLPLLAASQRTPGMGADPGFVILAAIALAASMALASWFETLVYRRLALGGIWVVLVIVAAGIIIHIPGTESAPTLGLPFGIAAIIAAGAAAWILIAKKMLYPKLDFFFPATAVLCLMAILTVV